MPDEKSTNENQEQEQEKPDAKSAEPTPTDNNEPLGEGGLKALKSERSARKDAEKLATQYKTDMEKLAERLEQLEAESAEAKAAQAEAMRKALQLEVASSLNLPPEIAKRLQGDTADEMKEDAKSIIEALNVDTRKFVIKDSSQGAGNAKSTGSVDAGRELYRSRHSKKD